MTSPSPSARMSCGSSGPTVQHTPCLSSNTSRGSSHSAAPGCQTRKRPEPAFTRKISYFEGCTCLSIIMPGGIATVEQFVTPGTSSYFRKSLMTSCWLFSCRRKKIQSRCFPSYTTRQNSSHLMKQTPRGQQICGRRADLYRGKPGRPRDIGCRQQSTARPSLCSGTLLFHRPTSFLVLH